MAPYRLKMPDVGEGVVEAEIVAWHVKVGDVVEEDQDLVDVMTDKATVEIPAPVSGTITALTGEPGDVIAVGTEILTIAPSGEAAIDAAPSGEAKPEIAGENTAAEPPAAEAAPPRPAAGVDAAMASASPAEERAGTSHLGGRPLASPSVRARALELDIDLAAVPGTGPAGRVLRADLDDFAAAGGRLLTKAGGTAQGARTPRTGVRDSKVIGLRRKIAANMEAAWSVPMITYVEEIDVTEVEALRTALNADRSPSQPKLTLLPFLAAALIRALADVPQANAHYDAEAGTLTTFEGVHLGIAAATEHGLMVPVLRHAEAMDLWDMAAEIARLSAAARDGSAKREELSGSSITITSLGAMGGITTTPILNLPETAIIGVNKMVERPVFDGAGRVVPRLFINLSSSFDHRIVDGYDCAVLIQKVRTLMETPARLFI
ncbi:MAG: dihydrolipoamide acetyltransferase family protein [Pseudomonadota bacterium]